LNKLAQYAVMLFLIIAIIIFAFATQQAPKDPRNNPLYPTNGQCEDYECVALATQACDAKQGITYVPAKYNKPPRVETYFFSGWDDNSCTVTRSIRTGPVDAINRICTFAKQNVANVDLVAKRLKEDCFE